MTREPWARRRAMQLVEDVIRIYPEGAPREVVLDRLARVGYGRGETTQLLTALLQRRRILLYGERFLLAS